MSPTSADKKLSISSESDTEFLCGVVEGFYGRPWTTEQRKDLFTKMQVCYQAVILLYKACITYNNIACLCEFWLYQFGNLEIFCDKFYKIEVPI